MSNAWGSTGPDLTLHDVAEELGVHYMTAYRYVRSSALPARKSGGVWTVERDVLESFRSRAGGGRVAAVPATDGDEGSIDGAEAVREDRDISTALRQSLIAGDWHRAERLIEGTCRGRTRTAATEEVVRLVGDAMRDIGERWAVGDVTMAQEHLATTTVQRVLTRCSSPPPGRRRGCAIVVAAPGDLHTLPSTLFAELLAAHNVDVLDIGAGHGAEELLDVVSSRYGAVCVCLTATSPTDDEAIVAATAAIAGYGSDVPIGIGGSAIGSWAEASRLGATFWAADAVEAARLAAAEARRVA